MSEFSVPTHLALSAKQLSYCKSRQARLQALIRDLDSEELAMAAAALVTSNEIVAAALSEQSARLHTTNN